MISQKAEHITYLWKIEDEWFNWGYAAAVSEYLVGDRLTCQEGNRKVTKNYQIAVNHNLHVNALEMIRYFINRCIYAMSYIVKFVWINRNRHKQLLYLKLYHTRIHINSCLLAKAKNFLLNCQRKKIPETINILRIPCPSLNTTPKHVKPTTVKMLKL